MVWWEEAYLLFDLVGLFLRNMSHVTFQHLGDVGRGTLPSFQLSIGYVALEKVCPAGKVHKYVAILPQLC